MDDPAGSKNLADDPAFVAKLAEMKNRLKAAQETGDSGLLKWQYE